MRKNHPPRLHARTKERLILESKMVLKYKLRYAEGEKSSEIIDDLANEYERSAATVYEILRPVKRLQNVKSA